ncbi:MAG: DUF4405 domain-containing protein [Rhodospirillaceae bacterium]|nr:DUF4405 domain-containing protein [Rhodospirillales bacterium]
MTTQNPADQGFDAMLRKYATQATSALAVVIGVTGVMMFFRIAKGEVEAMHEWLGLTFVAVAALHVVRHRRGFMAMLRQPRMRALFVVTAVAALAFLVRGPVKQGNPLRQITQMTANAPLSALAPVMGVSTEELTTRLQGAGLTVTGTDQSIDSIAKAQGRDPIGVLADLLKK